MTTTLQTTPKRIEASDESRCSDKFWKEDPGDAYVPTSRGLISDLVYYTRGMEVPTLFVIWSALYAISTLVKREVWFDWFPSKLYTNFYTMIVGPAGIVKKNTAIDLAAAMLSRTEDYILDAQMKEIKRLTLVRDKSTPEALLQSLDPSRRPGQDFQLSDASGNPMTDKNGAPIMYYKTSEMGIMAHELAAMIGKQQYQTGFIENLLTLYDTHDVFYWDTVKRGRVKLRNMHTTFIGATTPDGFKGSIPTVARGDGFLARCIVVYQSTTMRRFHRPRHVPGAPTIEDLSKRLAWIGETSMGGYDFSPEADAAFALWYEDFKDMLDKDIAYQGMRSRLDVLLRKVALLIRLQRYDATDRVISLQDFEDARRLVMHTTHESFPLLRSITVGDDPQLVNITKIEDYIRRRVRVSRKDMMQHGHMRADELSVCVDTLVGEGKVAVYRKRHPNDDEATLVNSTSRDSSEIYVWIAPEV